MNPQDQPQKYRKIIHLDLDAFFCSVEERRKPELRDKAFAVGGLPEHRGVVSSCSYAARRKGVRSAMPMSRALRLCPEMLVISPDFSAYAEASHQVMDRLHQITPLIEQISIDEAFLDVSDLPDLPEQIARRLQEQIRLELGLPCSLGIAANKLVAKIATDAGKAAAIKDPAHPSGPPYAITLVPPGTEAEFLAPLSTLALWGIGPKTAVRLAGQGIQTIGDLAKCSQADLAERFGKNGYELSLRARGIDDRPVETSREVKSISREVTFAIDELDSKLLSRTLRELADDVGRSLRKEGLVGSTIKLKLRWSDFTTLSRQVTLPQPTDLDETIYKTAVELFQKAWQPRQPVRLIGVGVSGFGKIVQQLSLWESSSAAQTQQKKKQQLQRAVDVLHEKYGDQILKRGTDEKHSHP
jgi:DNA polymerase-4